MANSIIGAVFACSYAPPGRGKTLDAVKTYPNAVIMAQPGDVRPAVAYLGVPLENDQVEEVHLLTEATARVRYWTQHGLPANRWGIVVDDATVKAENDLARIEPDYPPTGDNVYRMWGHVLGIVIDFRDACDACPYPVFVTAHERSPDDKCLIGGPKFPARSNHEPFCRRLTHVLRIGRASTRKSTWKGVYLCDNGHPSWVMKDRDGVFLKEAPQNFREHLLLADMVAGRDAAHPEYQTPDRHWDMTWMDEWVDWAHDGLAAKENPKKLREELNAALAAADPRHVRWVWDDAVDRFEIRTAFNKLLYGV